MCQNRLGARTSSAKLSISKKGMKGFEAVRLNRTAQTSESTLKEDRSVRKQMALFTDS